MTACHKRFYEQSEKNRSSWIQLTIGKEEASDGGESGWKKSCQNFFQRISAVRIDQNDQISFYYHSE